jgi:tetratricopeptide (TPR) repeat protein
MTAIVACHATSEPKEMTMRIAAGQMCLPLALLAALATVSPAQIPLIEQGRAAIGRGDDEAAIAILEKAVAQSPKSAEAHFCLANAYGSKAQKSGMLGAVTYGPKAKGEFEAAVALDPKHVEARYALVQFYAGAPEMMGGSFDAALEQAKAIKVLDTIVGHRAYAFVYAQQKKLDLAKQEYMVAIREQPDSPKAHSYFGQYLSSVEKNYSAASAEFETALKLDPNYMPGCYHLGRTAALADTNLARGEASLKRYLDYTPKENEPTLARAHYFLGAIYEKEGKKAEAKQSYQAALKLNPALKEASDALKRVP